MRGLAELETSAAALIHGVFVYIHPFWRDTIDFDRELGVYRRHGPRLYYPSGPNDWIAEHHGPYDLNYKPEGWRSYVAHLGVKHDDPFLVRIYVFPTRPDTIERRRIIEDYAAQQPLFASVVDSPVPVLAANVEGGASIVATEPGTLGGFLKDKSGRVWGVTCAHVAQNSGTSVTLIDPAGNQTKNLATVRYTNFGALAPVSQTSQCNPYLHGAAKTTCDAALIELTATHLGLDSVRSVGKIDKIYAKTDLNVGNTVAMYGAASHLHDYDIAGYGVSCKIDSGQNNNTYICMSDLFEFSAPGSRFWSWLPPRVRQAIMFQPLQGDSGAWLCHNHTGSSTNPTYAYFGNMIAVRGAMGLATFADNLVDWARAESNHTVELTV
jgi:hypothetical protein